MICDLCKDTGWYGDNGPGIKGNDEYQKCECRIETKYRTCHVCNGTGIIKNSEHKRG